MNSTNKDKKTLEWATELFRPIMRDMHLQEISEGEDKILTTSAYREMHRHGMANCVIRARRVPFTKSDYKGMFVWQYNKEFRIYILNILLNDDLYATDDEALCIDRKASTTHEFVHCIATMLTVAGLKTDLVIEREHEKLKTSVHALQQDDVKSILRDISQPRKEMKSDMLTFPDSHFRTGDEDFQGSYSDLYTNLLLSYQLFREFFTDEIMKKFVGELYTDKEAAARTLNSVLSEIARKKHLPDDFVDVRFKEITPLLVREFHEKGLI